ncbi:hypothetical protein R83H12_01317 [Fibrobacteria bacterium R8-3-H12]
MANTSIFNLRIAGLNEKLGVLSFNILEGISGDDTLSIGFMASSKGLSQSLIGKEAYFSFEFSGKKEFFNGWVASCSVEQAGAVSRASIEVKTIRHKLDKEKKYAVYCQSDIESIARSVISKAGISNFKCSLKSFYEVDFKIQYNETDLNFLQRILEEFSIIEFVKHSDGKSELFVSDTGEFSGSATNLTKCRLEMTDNGNFFFGYGHYPMRPGTSFGAFGDVFIVCSAYHQGSQEAAYGIKDKNDGYTCQVAAFSKRMLKTMPRSKEKPQVPGIIVAKTEGFVGSYASIDTQGRYIVRMPFDDKNVGMTSSIPVHLAQSFVGVNCGVHFPLRKDVPILIAFENGDIDKPIALGAIPTGAHTGPVIGANSFQNILKTHSGIKFTFNDLTCGLDIEAPRNISMTAGNELVLEGKKKSILKTQTGTKLCMDEVAGKLDMEAKKSISLKTERTRLGLGDSGKSINMGAAKDVSINAKEKLFLTGKKQSVLKTKKLQIESSGDICIKAGGKLVLKGAVVEIN